MKVVPLAPRRRRRGVLLALAAAIAVAAFALGATLVEGPSGRSVDFELAMKGTPAAASSSGSLVVLRARRRRELPMELRVAGLPPRSARTVRALADPQRQARRTLRRVRHRRKRVGRGADERAVPPGRLRRLGCRRGGVDDAAPHHLSRRYCTSAPPGACARYRRSDGPVRGLRPSRARDGVPKGDRTGTGTRQRLRPPDALRPARGLPAGDDQEGALQIDRRTSSSGSCAATPTSAGFRSTA